MINHIIQQLQDIQSGPLWMGDDFKKKFKSISENEAFIQPAKDLHSPAELVSHLTAWNGDILDKLTGGTGNVKFRTDQDWPPIDKLKQKGWEMIVEEFYSSISKISDDLENRPEDFYKSSYYDGSYQKEVAYSFLLDGLIHHLIYHLGQLGIVIKLIFSEQNYENFCTKSLFGVYSS